MKIRPFGLAIIMALVSSGFSHSDSVKSLGLRLVSFVIRCEKDSVLIFTGCENQSDREYFVWPVEFNFWGVGGFNRKTFDHKDIMEKSLMWGTTDKPVIDEVGMVPLPPKGIFGRIISFPKTFFKPSDFQNKYLMEMGLDLHVKSRNPDTVQELRVSGELMGRNIANCLDRPKKK